MFNKFEPKTGDSVFPVFRNQETGQLEVDGQKWLFVGQEAGTKKLFVGSLYNGEAKEAAFVSYSWDIATAFAISLNNQISTTLDMANLPMLQSDSGVADPVSGQVCPDPKYPDKQCLPPVSKQTAKPTIAVFDPSLDGQSIYLRGGIEADVCLPKGGCQLAIGAVVNGGISFYLVDTRVPPPNVSWWHKQIKWKYGRQDPNLSDQIDLPWSLLPDNRLHFPSGIECIEIETPYLHFRLFPDGRKEYV